jgi:hypothetical protein
MRLKLKFESLLVPIEKLLVLARWKLREDPLQDPAVEKIVDHHMRKRRCSPVLVSERTAEFSAFVRIEHEITVYGMEMKHLTVLPRWVDDGSGIDVNRGHSAHMCRK